MRAYLGAGTFVLFLLSLAAGCSDRSADPAPIAPGPPPDNPQQNIILIIIDTLRADHLSCYGYHRNTSPGIDSLASEGTIWLNAQAQAPWTQPAHATIWTGLSVRAHRTLNPVAVTNDSGQMVKLIYELDRDLPTISTLLNDAGFSTMGLANFIILSPTYGFAEGFDSYSFRRDGQGVAGASVDSVIAWLGDNGDQRFYCMLHLYDVHSPYSPPPPYNTAFQDDPELTWFDWELEDEQVLNSDEVQKAIDLYDGEIAYVDHHLNRLFRWIRANGLEDETLVVVMADHGEEFMEHGWVLHGTSMYQEVLHVPLIMSGPGIRRGMADSTWVAQFDVLPTLISWAGVELSGACEGTDILEDSIAPRTIPSSGASDSPWKACEQMAAVVSTSTDVKTFMLDGMEDFVSYDLETDPEEQSPMVADSIATEQVLYYWATPPVGSPEFANSDEQALQTLRDLGYIDD